MIRNAKINTGYIVVEEKVDSKLVKESKIKVVDRVTSYSVLPHRKSLFCRTLCKEILRVKTWKLSSTASAIKHYSRDDDLWHRIELWETSARRNATSLPSAAGWRIFKMDTIVDFRPPWSIPVPLYIKFSLRGGVITVSCVVNQIGVPIWFVCPGHWLHPDELGHM